MSWGGVAAPPDGSSIYSTSPDGVAHLAPTTPHGRSVFALVGNPNCGKTTLFNALTGLRQKVGNYPGVTVERKEGTVNLPASHSEPGEPEHARHAVALVDLPGLYSLTPHSPDERIARDVLMGYRNDSPRPQAIINVVDASNLERNLYLTSQLLDLGLPVLVVLTMTDTAEEHGVRVEAGAMQKVLGVSVCAVVASRRTGFAELYGRDGGLADTSPAAPAPLDATGPCRAGGRGDGGPAAPPARPSRTQCVQRGDLAAWTARRQRDRPHRALVSRDSCASDRRPRDTRRCGCRCRSFDRRSALCRCRTRRRPIDAPCRPAQAIAFRTPGPGLPAPRLGLRDLSCA